MEVGDAVSKIESLWYWENALAVTVQDVENSVFDLLQVVVVSEPNWAVRSNTVRSAICRRSTIASIILCLPGSQEKCNLFFFAFSFFNKQFAHLQAVAI